ncbi:MAG: hypothetical protein ACK5LN_03235 [Propioniciclava sp.]
MTLSADATPDTGVARTDISRRSLTKGLAWTIPAVGAVSAAPGVAATTKTNECVVKNEWGQDSKFYQIRWSASHGTEVITRFPGYNPTSRCDGVSVYRRVLEFTPHGLRGCGTNGADITIRATTTYYGAHTMDSVSCNPNGTWYEPGGDKCAPGNEFNNEAGGNCQGRTNYGGTCCSWHDGANLVLQNGTPRGGSIVAGTEEALSIGWNSGGNGNTANPERITSTNELTNYATWDFQFVGGTVKDLRFSIYDLDYGRFQNKFNGRERFFFSSNAAYSTTQGPLVGGAGIPRNPWCALNPADLDANDARGAVNINFSGKVSNFRITAWSRDCTYTPENLWLSNFWIACPDCMS